MPIYEYRCKECDTVFPRLQKIGAGLQGVACPKCGGSDVDRILSIFASADGGDDDGAVAGGGCGSSGFS